VGRGWSSFAVVGEFCVTQEQRDNSEAIVCYELRTGNEIWRRLDPLRFDEVTSGPGPRATPAIDQGQVFAMGATGLVNCLHGAIGAAAWSRDIAKDIPPILFGYCSSPLVFGDKVYLTPGGKAGAIVALDRHTGQVLWSHGSAKPGYASPQLFLTRSEIQILVFDASGLHGHDADSGEQRWSFPWGDDSDEQVNVCQPVVVPQAGESDPRAPESHQVLISSGYGRGAALLKIACDTDGKWTANRIWQAKTLKSKFSSIVVRDQFAYGLDDGVLACISLADGARRWKQGRYGHGQLILVNDTLLIQAESGEVALVKADPQGFTELATLDALGDRTWNHPVVAGRFLLVRNDREAVCFELPIPQ
jgi:outer membrane protein assembly factor BamB